MRNADNAKPRLGRGKMRKTINGGSQKEHAGKWRNAIGEPSNNNNHMKLNKSSVRKQLKKQEGKKQQQWQLEEMKMKEEQEQWDRAEEEATHKVEVEMRNVSEEEGIQKAKEDARK